MKILKITHDKMTLYLFQWVGFFQIKNVEDIERCFLRVAYWNYDMYWKEHCDGVRTRPIKFSFIQQKLLFQWRKFLHDLLLVIFNGKEVHIICVRISSKSLYHMKRHPSNRSEEKVAIVIMDQVLLIQYTLRMLSISLSFIHLW